MTTETERLARWVGWAYLGEIYGDGGYPHRWKTPKGGQIATLNSTMPSPNYPQSLDACTNDLGGKIKTLPEEDQARFVDFLLEEVQFGVDYNAEYRRLLDLTAEHYVNAAIKLLDHLEEK